MSTEAPIPIATTQASRNDLAHLVVTRWDIVEPDMELFKLFNPDDRLQLPTLHQVSTFEDGSQQRELVEGLTFTERWDLLSVVNNRIRSRRSN